MKEFLIEIFKSHAGQMFAALVGVVTASVGWFTVGRHKKNKERFDIKVENDTTIREQLLKVNTELSKVFELHVAEAKKFHGERLENVRLNSLIESIKMNCPSSCLDDLIKAIEEDKTNNS